MKVLLNLAFNNVIVYFRNTVFIINNYSVALIYKAGLDAFAEELCAPFYAKKLGLQLSDLFPVREFLRNHLKFQIFFWHESSKTVQNNFRRIMPLPTTAFFGYLLSRRETCCCFDKNATYRYERMQSCRSQARKRKSMVFFRYFSCIFNKFTQVRKLSYEK